MMGWYQSGWGWAGFLGMGTMVIVWGALIALAVWAIARFTRAETPSVTPTESARAVLDRRFAAGDIDLDDYARKRRALESPNTTGVMPASP
jgi:putative membrane protein